MTLPGRLSLYSQKGRILTRRTTEDHGAPRRQQVRRFARNAGVLFLLFQRHSVVLGELHVESFFFVPLLCAESKP
jgi:hypothetical protein